MFVVLKTYFFSVKITEKGWNTLNECQCVYYHVYTSDSMENMSKEHQNICPKDAWKNIIYCIFNI